MSSHKPRVIDQAEVERSLRELHGIASILLDASRCDDVSQSGAEAIARFIETIHGRLVDAFDLEGDQR